MLEEYIMVVAKMRMTRNPLTINEYKYYDKRRQEIHNEILRLAGKTRDDLAFSFKLAQTVEEALDKLGF